MPNNRIEQNEAFLDQDFYIHPDNAWKGNYLTRIRTDKLDAAGNTTAAIGKGFAIGSACLVALALFGAFATRTHLDVVNVLEPLQFAGLVVGAMLPYAFTALTMKAVGTSAESMIEEIAR